MFEVELKARVGSLDDLRDYLVSKLGFNVLDYVAEDYYFDHPCRSFNRSEEELRLRFERRGESSKWVLTYKAKPLTSDRSAREEIEVFVGNGMMDILSKLGFKVAVFKRKEGWFLLKDDLEIVICSVRGVYENKAFFLGNYMEVEVRVRSKEDIEEARKRIRDFIKGLPGVIKLDMEYYVEKLKKLAEKEGKG